VAQIVQPITRLFERAWERGVRNIVLTQDTHEPQAVEFAQWPPHCVRGTAESETVPEFQALPFFDQIQVFEKNSISSGLNAGLNEWLETHPEVDTFVVTGDCTDLCTYQLAMHLRLDANERQISRRVILPENCVQTYDRPVEVAETQGGLPHPGDLIHAVFLYHMQLNGVEVVSEIQ
jgi:nicotinamidase-related amidase